MTQNQDTYTAVTPFGPVAIEFPEGGGSLFSGDDASIYHLHDVMARNANGCGVSMTPRNLEPSDLVNFCQPEGSGVAIIEPLGALVRGVDVSGS